MNKWPDLTFNDMVGFPLDGGPRDCNDVGLLVFRSTEAILVHLHEFFKSKLKSTAVPFS